MNNLWNELREILKEEELFLNEPMKNHTTFQVGGPADLLVRPPLEKISGVMNLCKVNKIPVTFIGNGSNLLVGDKGIRGVVIEFGEQAAEVVCEGTNIRAQSGSLLSKTAQIALESSLTGMEFAAGIPGSVGGAVVMNAGAYGGEMKDIVSAVKVLTQNGDIRILSREEMDFSYRHSCIPVFHHLVLEVVLGLKEGDTKDISSCMQELKERRESKQPLEYGSAGSTFKRPVGHYAGKLIMDAGLSGYMLGQAQVSEKHCGFVINKGGATAAEIRGLIEYVKQVVWDKNQVILETEVRMIGEF